MYILRQSCGYSGTERTRRQYHHEIMNVYMYIYTAMIVFVVRAVQNM